MIVLFIPAEDAQEVITEARRLALLVSQQSGYVIEARISTDYAAAIEAMCSGEAHVVTLNTFGYVLASQRGCGDVALVSVRFGNTYYQGQIVARSNSGIENYLGLKGKTFCRPDALSTSGWVIPSIAMRANGIDPEEDVEIVDAGSHDAVITAVYQGDCDAGATFADARSNVDTEMPDVRDVVVVVDLSAPIPNDTISFASDVPQDVREKVVRAFLDIAADEGHAEVFGAVYNWSGLEVADDTFFDDFREQLDAAGIDIENLQ